MKSKTALCLFGLWPVSLAAQEQKIEPAIQSVVEEHFRNRASTYNIGNPVQNLRARKAARDEFGVTHVRYDQFHNGVKIFEGEAIAHVDTGFGVTVTSALRQNVSVDVRPGVPQDAAIASAVRGLAIKGSHSQPRASLLILPRGERSPVDLLVWHVQTEVENGIDPPAHWEAFVDARNGMLLWAFDSLESSATFGTGKTMYSGDVTLSLDASGGPPPFYLPTYRLADPTRGSLGGNYTVDMNDLTTGSGTLFQQLLNPVFGNNQKDSSNRATAGADAHFGLQKAWDYFLFKHSRNGWDGLGTRAHARVHYGTNVENAYWDSTCKCLKLGDGGATYGPLVSLDVVGHEFAHGVMSAEAALTYSGESGGLNEASSDIFGTMVEYYAAAPWDAGDYRIGEKPRRINWGPFAPYPPFALRYMFDPALDGKSPACWYSGIGSLNVHYSSGPANHMFYLLAEGGTSKCNSNVVAGIGRDAAAKIWYKAIRDYMTSGTNYAGARVACVSAAATTYGLYSPQYNAVKAAFSAIGVN